MCEMDGQPRGLIVLTTNDQMLGKIELLVANPDAAGHGIGTALNQFALDRLREQGMVYAIAVTTDDPGHAAARCSYANVGLVPMPVQWDFVVTRLSVQRAGTLSLAIRTDDGRRFGRRARVGQSSPTFGASEKEAS